MLDRSIIFVLFICFMMLVLTPFMLLYLAMHITNC